MVFSLPPQIPPPQGTANTVANVVMRPDVNARLKFIVLIRLIKVRLSNLPKVTQIKTVEPE